MTVDPDKVSIRSKVIGKGSFATVYLARNEETLSLLAVKSIDKHRLSKRIYASICSEIQMMKKIKSDHIITLLAVQETPETIKLYTEYCSLGDLSVFLKNEKQRNHLGGISLFYIHSFLLQLASALQVMRKMNLIHRDLKPQNILLHRTDGKIVLKLGDFGFARILFGEDMAETLCGSPLYMAPEILRYEKYDAKADLWSVGILLYEMITGKTPFRARNHIALLKKIQMTRNVLFPDEIVDQRIALADTSSISSPIRIPKSPVTHEKVISVSYDNKNTENNDSNQISIDLRNLTRSLLKKDPLERISFEEFFLHPCVRLGTSYFNQARKFSNQNSFKENQYGTSDSLEFPFKFSPHSPKYSVSDPLSNNSSMDSRLGLAVVRRLNSSLSTLRPSPTLFSQEVPFPMDDDLISSRKSVTINENESSSRRLRKKFEDETRDLGVWNPMLPALTLPFAHRPPVSEVKPESEESSPPESPNQLQIETVSEELNQPKTIYESLSAVVKVVKDSVRNVVGFPVLDYDEAEDNTEENEDGFVFVNNN